MTAPLRIGLAGDEFSLADARTTAGSVASAAAFQASCGAAIGYFVERFAGRMESR